MQFVASWQDNVTAGISASLRALERLKAGAADTDKALKSVAAPKKMKPDAAAKALEASRSYVGKIKDRHLADEDKRRKKEEADEKKAQDVAAKRKDSSRSYVAKIKDQYFADEDRKRRKEESDEKKRNDREAKRAESEAKRNAPFNPFEFQQKFLGQYTRGVQKDNAVAGLGLGLSRQEKDAKRKADSDQKKQIADQKRAQKDRERDAKAAKAADEKRRVSSGSNLIALGFAGAMIGLIWKSVSAAKALATQFAVLSLGPYGLARANALIDQAGMRFQRMFIGINTKPATDALAKFLSFTNQQTTAGKVIASTVQRWGNLLMGAFTGAEPMASQFLDGLIIGVLKAEASFWRLATAGVPIISFLSDANDWMLENNVYLDMGEAIVRAMVAPLQDSATFLSAMAASADWLALSLANAFGSLASIPIIGPKFADMAASLRAGVDPENAAAYGAKAGAALGGGLAGGIIASLPKIKAAGKAAVDAADSAVIDKAEIHSPSRLFARSGGYMAAGLAMGIMAGAGDVALAAREALVPDVGALASRSAPLAPGALVGGGAAATQRPIQVILQGDVYGIEDFESRVERAARHAIEEDNAATGKELGVA